MAVSEGAECKQRSMVAEADLQSAASTCSGNVSTKAKRSTEAPKKSNKKQRTRSKVEEAAELACAPEKSDTGRGDVRSCRRAIAAAFEHVCLMTSGMITACRRRGRSPAAIQKYQQRAGAASVLQQRCNTGKMATQSSVRQATLGITQRVMQGVDYTAKTEVKVRVADRVAVKEEAQAETEPEALASLPGEGSAPFYRCHPGCTTLFCGISQAAGTSGTFACRHI